MERLVVFRVFWVSRMFRVLGEVWGEWELGELGMFCISGV